MKDQQPNKGTVETHDAGKLLEPGTAAFGANVSRQELSELTDRASATKKGTRVLTEA